MRIKPCFANDVNIVFLNFWVRIAVLKNKRGIARIAGNKKDPLGRGAVKQKNQKTVEIPTEAIRRFPLMFVYFADILLNIIISLMLYISVCALRRYLR